MHGGYTFAGVTDRSTLTREQNNFENKHLRAYLQGKIYFNFHGKRFLVQRTRLNKNKIAAAVEKVIDQVRSNPENKKSIWTRIKAFFQKILSKFSNGH